MPKRKGEREITNDLALNEQDIYNRIMRTQIREKLGRDVILFNPEDIPYLSEIINLNEDDLLTLRAKRAFKHTQLILIMNDMFEGVPAHAVGEADLEDLYALSVNRGMDQAVSIEHILRILRDKLDLAKLGTPFDPVTIDFLIRIRDDPTTPPDISHRADLAIRVINGFDVGLIGDVNKSYVGLIGDVKRTKKKGGALKKSKRNKKRVRKTKKK